MLFAIHIYMLGLVGPLGLFAHGQIDMHAGRIVTAVKTLCLHYIVSVIWRGSGKIKQTLFCYFFFHSISLSFQRTIAQSVAMRDAHISIFSITRLKSRLHFRREEKKKEKKSECVHNFLDRIIKIIIEMVDVFTGWECRF